MEARLEVLLTRANGIVAVHKEITGDINISPYRSGLVMYVSTQLKEALALIHPDSMKKYNLPMNKRDQMQKKTKPETGLENCWWKGNKI